MKTLKPIKYVQKYDNDFIFYAQDKNSEIYIYRKGEDFPNCWEWIDKKTQSDSWWYADSIIHRLSHSTPIDLKGLKKLNVPPIDEKKLVKFTPSKI